MPRILLFLLASLLLCLGLAFYAYVSYDPRVESALDRSDVLPEGKGFAPRPSLERLKAKASVGRWLREWVDARAGEPKRRGPRLHEVRVLADPVFLGSPGGLRVRVRGVDGNPAASIAVTVYVPAGVAVRAPQWTDESGEARFDGLPSGPGYVVEATKSDPGARSSTRKGVQVPPDGVGDVDLALPGGMVEGQVIDLDTGKPVPHAAVTGARWAPRDDQGPIRWARFGHSHGPGGLGSTAADGEGRFRLGPFPSGPLILFWARAADGRTGVGGLRLEEPSTSPVAVPVGRVPAIAGILVDEDDRPVAGALVRIATSDVEARSGDEGQFTLHPEAPGFLVVEREGVALSRWTADVLRPGEVARVRIPTRTALAIRVVDGGGGGVPGVTLLVSGHDAGMPDARRRYLSFAAADADGRARFPVLPGRVDRIVVSEAGGKVTFDTDDDLREPYTGARFLDLPTPIEAGELRDVVLTVPPGIAVRGRAVLLDGRPASRARIDGRSTGWDRDVHDVAAADGTFRLRRLHVEPVAELPDEVVRLTAHIDGVAQQELDLTPRLADIRDGILDVGDVVLHPPAMLRGRIVDADGSPIARARVRAGSRSAPVLTDAQGVYRIPVEPSEHLELTARAPGTREREVKVLGALRPGEVRDVEPIFLRRPLTLRVRVVDANLAPIAGARVRLPQAPSAPVLPPPESDAEGWVEFPAYGTSARSPFEEEDDMATFLASVLDRGGGPSLLVTRPDGFGVLRKLDVPADAVDPFDVLVVVPERVVVQGLALDERGLPVADLGVSASVGKIWRGAPSPYDIGRVTRAAHRATTDAAGRYRLELAAIPGEVWKITATHEDGRTATQETALPSGSPVDLVLRKADVAGGKDGSGK